MRYRLTFVLAVGLGLVVRPLPAGEPTPISPEQVDRLHRLIKPAAGESRWMEIAWHPSVWEGLKKAAAEGKPLFIYSGGGATGIGPC